MTLTEAMFSGIGVVIVAATPVILAQLSARKELQLQKDKLDAVEKMTAQDAKVNAEALEKLKGLEIKVDGNLAHMMEILERASRAKGKLEGRAELKAEHAAAKASEGPAVLEVHVDLTPPIDATRDPET